MRSIRVSRIWAMRGRWAGSARTRFNEIAAATAYTSGHIQ
jgi:hypothetical protein